MPDIIRCPTCQGQMQVPDDLMGRMVKCPTCGGTFRAEVTAATSPSRAEAAMPTATYGPEPSAAAASPTAKPVRIEQIAYVTLAGGIVATLIGVFGLIGAAGSGFLCCLWPGTYYSLAVGILALIKGINLMGPNAHLETSPRTVAIMQIINIVNFDIPNLVMGILTLNWLKEPEVEQYFRGR